MEHSLLWSYPLPTVQVLPYWSPTEMLVFTIAFAGLLFDPVHAVSAASQDGSRYDFLIIGGGTSGLVVANRLSEMRNVTVAVIEAGDSVLNNHNVTEIMGYGLSFGTNIDWAYQTENQTYAGGSTQIMRAGKAIGGTSTINGNGSSEQIDEGSVLTRAFSHRNVVYPSPKRANRRLGAGWKHRLELG